MPRPAEQRLGGDPSELRLDVRPERKLVRLGRAERDVAAFARHRHPEPAGLDQRADAEPGARSEHDLGAGLRRRIAADLHEVLRLQRGQRQRQRLEVVEKNDVLDAEPRHHLRRADHPVRVGELRPRRRRSGRRDRSSPSAAGARSWRGPSSRSPPRCRGNRRSPPTEMSAAARRDRESAQSGRSCRRCPRSAPGRPSVRAWRSWPCRAPRIVVVTIGITRPSRGFIARRPPSPPER